MDWPKTRSANFWSRCKKDRPFTLQWALADDTEVFYQMSRYYSPESSRGVRWDDPAFGIIWPEDTRMINARDRQYPNFVS
jgi:dTDP-4-dehydrorhamnose 3,5-epimerase-like enzyme